MRAGGGPGSPCGSKENQKCVYSCCCDTRFFGEAPEQPGRAPSCLPPSQISLGRTRARTAQGEANGKVSRFFLCPAPVPTSSFLGFAAAGEGLIRFASKGCIYSVLLREARKHPGRPGRWDGGGGDSQAPTAGACVYACSTPRSQACGAAHSFGRVAAEMRGVWPPPLTTRARRSLGMDLRTECVL